jgi:ubiquinone/menaquinone biosynthesis C-methylase UbiE
MLSLLQAFRFADTDVGHVRRLLLWAELPEGAAVLDLGGGAGFVAAQMLDERPDLSICLVDRDPAMLALADARLRVCCADISAVPEPDQSFDAVICCYAAGYVEADAFFAEARRLLRPGGVVFLVDMTPVSPTADTVSLFGYTIRSRRRVDESAAAAGLRLDVHIEPVDDSGWGERQFPHYFHVLFGEVRPGVWRFKG